MGRIRRHIEIEGKNYWTLFDSRARNTYVTQDVARHLPTFDMPTTNPVALGSKTHTITKDCRLVGNIDGFSVLTNAWVIDDIGKDEDGNKIEILFGALAMQQWGIKLNLPSEALDLSHYPKEFVEF